MAVIHPTNHCFDDALELVADKLKASPHAAQHEIKLVHAICLMPDGEPFSHAWVENIYGLAYFFGILDGERVLVTADAGEYRAELRVQEFTEYDPHDAWEQNQKHATYGPWDEKYRRLCK